MAGKPFRLVKFAQGIAARAVQSCKPDVFHPPPAMQEMTVMKSIFVPVAAASLVALAAGAAVAMPGGAGAMRGSHDAMHARQATPAHARDHGRDHEREGRGRMEGRGSGHMDGRGAANVEQRLEGLKDRLKITATQEPQWQAFAEATRAQSRAFAAAQAEMWQRRAAGETATTAPERLVQRDQQMTAHLEGRRQVTQAFTALYGALDAEQKKLADELVSGRHGRR